MTIREDCLGLSQDLVACRRHQCTNPTGADIDPDDHSRGMRRHISTDPAIQESVNPTRAWVPNKRFY